MASSTSSKLLYWTYASNVLFQLLDVLAWLIHPPLLCSQARDSVSQMFVRAQSVLLAPLLLVFWMFRSVPLQGDGDEGTRALARIARGVACSFVGFHAGTEMTKTQLILGFHGGYVVAIAIAYHLSLVEFKWR